MRLIENKCNWFRRRSYSIVLNNNHSVLRIINNFLNRAESNNQFEKRQELFLKMMLFFERPAPD